MTVTTIDQAMLRALELAGRGPKHGPNPQVGCVLLTPDGAVVAEGWHRGAGTPHAEAAALRAARDDGTRVDGATAVVTLEPCSHFGRTPPCAAALADAGISRVVFAVADPDPAAAGGADYLRRHGVAVVQGVRGADGEDLLRVWLAAVRQGRPFVTLKLAQTLDGRIAARDGTSRWITGPEARAHAHQVRADVDAIVVGMGTVLADDPSLTARTPDGVLAAHQPVRVVVGRRDVPVDARLCGDGGPLVHLRTHDVHEVLAELRRLEVRHALIEGGSSLSTAFLRSGTVDEIQAYLTPVILGAGLPALGDLGIDTVSAGMRFGNRGVDVLGDDVLLTLEVRRDGPPWHRAPTSEPDEQERH